MILNVGLGKYLIFIYEINNFVIIIHLLKFNTLILNTILFRLSKESFMVLLYMIEDNIKHRTCRNNAILPAIQLLVALRFYATGAFEVQFINHYQIT